ncbi:MAG: site-2 protease family protein, partial [Firmicutes bacterium]|nr:site-2 protease family protein [Candidatus Colimorpha enterica]
MSILIAILIFGFLIFIHELGHYTTARIFGVKIEEFAIGMGPKLASYTSDKTNITYSWRLLPFGGFVSMAGEDEESTDENALNKKPAWQRFIIMIAGSFMN